MKTFFRKFYDKYLIHFPDFWQYIVIILIFAIGAIFFL